MEYILYNPKSNNGRGDRGIARVIEAGKERHPDIAAPEVLDLTKTDVAALLEGLTEDDTVIITGGDGTLHHFVNDIEGVTVRASVYVWSEGTGNDFVRDVGGKKNTLVPLNEYIENLPSAVIDGRRRRFINNVCFGIDGQVCELGEQEKERLGRKVNFALLAVHLALRDYKLTGATVTVDGVTKRYDKVWLASALNGRYVGGGMKLAPDQDRKSGKLCCVVLRGTGRFYLLSRLASVYWGGHVKIPCCEVMFGNDIQVEFDEPTAINMDGDVYPRTTGYHAVKEPVTEKIAVTV